ncbi:hypothetical protein ACJMK2_035393 [Sinanodonta woodiana]|uniref:Uncharacterized protein n=1 Tax=Sinanodonta woodiana TaxID=1069815 RepID=A0ABD3WUT5_SINWO
MDEDLIKSGDNLEMVNDEDHFQEAILKIQSRRLPEVRRKLKVEFTSTPKYKLTPKEKEKLVGRKSRDNLLLREETIRIKEEQAIYDNVKMEVITPRTVRKFLQVYIINHLARCPKYITIRPQESTMNSLDRIMELRKRDIVPT